MNVIRVDRSPLVFESQPKSFYASRKFESCIVAMEFRRDHARRYSPCLHFDYGDAEINAKEETGHEAEKAHKSQGIASGNAREPASTFLLPCFHPASITCYVSIFSFEHRVTSVRYELKLPVKIPKLSATFVNYARKILESIA